MKATPMTGEEFRFLRKQMDLTQSQLAERLDVDEQTVANYEKSKTKAGPANTAMRHLFVLHVLPLTSSVKSVKLLIDRDSRASNKPRSKIAGPWQETTQMAA
jgi:transcriptional regulator with XRE-family HTH domain